MMEEKPKIRSKKNLFKIGISCFIIICVIYVLASYLINDEFRSMVDTKILKKEVTEKSSKVIEINSDGNPYLFAYDRYITVLSKNVLTLYNQDANAVSKIDVNITTPYMTANNKYLALAEKGGQKLYLIFDTGIKWEKDIEGEIYRVNVNQNGYVSVLFKNTTYKSLIITYNPEGKELFRNYLARGHVAICSEISGNNKYLAIGQIDYSGAIVKSNVKLVSMDAAINNEPNTHLYTYESESSRILNNIKFNSKNEAICMFDSYIQKITTSSDERLYDITDENIFLDINLGDNIVIVEKENSGLFSHQYQMNIKSTTGKSDKLYILEKDVPKELALTRNLICIRLINEVSVINPSGWLIKRYTTDREMQNMLLGDSILGIVYNNKIEVIGL